MTKHRDDLADSFATDESGRGPGRFLADEEDFDRRTMWRLGSWAVGSVGALVLAFLASQSATQTRRDQIAAADLAQQAQQAQFIQRLARESQIENGRLASAIDTLNGDRDRLFSRLGTLEQELDSVTGSIAQRTQAAASPAPSTLPVQAPPPADKIGLNTPAQAAPPQPAPPESAPQAAAAPPQAAPAQSSSAPTTSATAPSIAQVESQPVPAAAPPQSAAAAAIKPAANKAVAAAAPLMPSKSILAPPDPAAGKLVEPSAPEAAKSQIASTEPQPEADAEKPAVAVQRTEFGVDLGSANSIDGLRAMWTRLAKSHKSLAALRPIIVVRERPRGGPQLRLVAGPLNDAAAAAKLCASLGDDGSCETSVFDGQRLPTSGPSGSSQPSRKRAAAPKVTTAPEPPPPEPKSSSLTSFLGLR